MLDEKVTKLEVENAELRTNLKDAGKVVMELRRELGQLSILHCEDVRIALATMAERTRLGATGKFPESKLNSEDEGELQMAITAKAANVILAFGKPVSWIGMAPKDARQMAVFLMDRANEADVYGPFLRASADAICEVCGDSYRHHPSDMKQLTSEGRPFLRVRCDGRRLKL